MHPQHTNSVFQIALDNSTKFNFACPDLFSGSYLLHLVRRIGEFTRKFEHDARRQTSLTTVRATMSRPDHKPDDWMRESSLDLTSEPTVGSRSNSTNISGSASERDNSPQPTIGPLKDVHVHFRCCNVYWRFPIPQDVLTGAKSSWFVHCPRCGNKLQLP